MNPINRVINTLRIMWLSQAYGWKSLTIYRTQFLFQMIYSAVGPLVTFFFISVIYTATAGIPGWSFYQLLFLSSLVGLVSTLMGYLTTSSGVLKSLRYGGLDIFLLRPYSKFTALMANYGDTTAGLAAIEASVLTVYAAAHLSFTLAAAVMFIIMLAIGVFLLSVFSLMLVTIFYKIFRSGGTFQGMLNTLYNYGQYPLSIYGFTVTLLLTFVVPIGFATYIPAELIIGNMTVVSFLEYAAIALLLAFVFYKIVLIRLSSYTSAMG